MGVGNFFECSRKLCSSRLYGVELDGITGRIAQQPPIPRRISRSRALKPRTDGTSLTSPSATPFGNYKVNDRLLITSFGFSIHNYFFAKAIDQVRPGGVIAFVTSRYTLDQQSLEVRKHRPARGAAGRDSPAEQRFPRQCRNGCRPDIIFLQKRDHPIDIEPDWASRPERGWFFHQQLLCRSSGDDSGHSEQGKHAVWPSDFTVLPVEGASLADQLHEAIQHIHGNYQEAALPDPVKTKHDESIPADPNVRNFSYAVVDGQVYYREKQPNGQAKPEPDCPGARERHG